MRVMLGGNLEPLQTAMRDTNSAVKLAEALGNTRDKRSVAVLMPLVTEPQEGAAVRRQAVRSLSQIREGAQDLLQLAKDNQLPDDVKFIATTELNRVRWQEVRKEAALILPLPKGRDSQPLPPLGELLRRHGDVAHGANVFARVDVQCVTCHRVNEKGADVGPALSEIGAKLGKDALYEAILDPSAGIEVGYEAWQITLKSGDDIVGIIKSETDDEVIVKDAKALATNIKKTDIQSRRKLKKSLMPDGLQQNLSTQDLVDLVEYLSSLKKATVQHAANDAK